MSAGTTHGMEKINLRRTLIGGRSLLIGCNHADGAVHLSKVSLKKKIIRALINTDNATGSGYFKVNRACCHTRTQSNRVKNISPQLHKSILPFQLLCNRCLSGISLMFYVLYYAHNSTDVLSYFLNVVAACLPLAQKSSG